MAPITQQDLEQWQFLQDAKSISDTFFNDRVTYLDEDFYLRTHTCAGIGKRIIEEYAALVRLAEECEQACGAKISLRLYRDSNPGPDGEIKFSSGIPSWNVQITCSNEGIEEANMRKQHANRQITSRMGAPSLLFQKQLKGIIEAIGKKNNKYYKGTDTLLVVDNALDVEYLHDLHQKVCEAISNDPDSPYKRIYVDYGGNLKRVK